MMTEWSMQSTSHSVIEKIAQIYVTFIIRGDRPFMMGANPILGMGLNPYRTHF